MRIAFAAALLVAATLSISYATKASETIVAEFSGTGAGTTRPFHTSGPWEFRWSCEPAGVFAASAYDADQPEPEPGISVEDILAQTGGRAGKDA